MSRAPEPSLALWNPGDPPVGLYVHVPFCRSICTYCAFAKGEYDEHRADHWLEGLEREIGVRQTTTWSGPPRLDTVFLGGGTPSALSPEQWDHLGSIIQKGFALEPEVEFTSEANPESFTPVIARAMRGAGVNRLSFGVQSFDPGELQLLGRPHDGDTAREAVAIARASGFDNLNLDLMYGLPAQSVATFARSLEAALALEPEHLSAYCLGLEPGTPLAESVAKHGPAPDEGTARDQYEHLVHQAAMSGYPLYEISNFSRPGRACRHNLRYWMRADVIGLGPSAHALLANHRWANPAPLTFWQQAYQPGGKVPTPREVPRTLARFEWMFLNLRLDQGISLEVFETVWGEPFSRVYGDTVGRMRAAGLLEETGGHLRLTPEARFVSDAVFAEFAPEP